MNQFRNYFGQSANCEKSSLSAARAADGTDIQGKLPKQGAGNRSRNASMLAA
jgi:hypothetical protein